MKESKRPLWKKSMLQSLDLSSIVDYLYEISENGDVYGYDGGDDGYYQEYKELFDDLAGDASALLDALNEYDGYGGGDVKDIWDEMTVALLGETQRVLGFDAVEQDYFGMIDCQENWAVEEAEKKLERFTNYHDMDKASERLQTANKALAAAYTAKSGMAEADALEMMDKETWLTAQQAVEKGLIDKVMFSDSGQLVAAFGGTMLPREVIEKTRNMLHPVAEPPKNREESDLLKAKLALQLAL